MEFLNLVHKRFEGKIEKAQEYISNLNKKGNLSDEEIAL